MPRRAMRLRTVSYTHLDVYKRQTLGDAVRVRIRRADLQKRQLDFELLLPDESGNRQKRDRSEQPGRGKQGRRR